MFSIPPFVQRPKTCAQTHSTHFYVERAVWGDETLWKIVMDGSLVFHRKERGWKFFFTLEIQPLTEIQVYSQCIVSPLCC